FEGKLYQNRSQIVDYDRTFDSLYAEIQQQIQRGNKRQVLQLLQTLQGDLREKETNVSNFIANVGMFKSEMIAYARQLQNDMTPIHSRMEMYQTDIQNLEKRLESEPSAKTREKIAEEMMGPSALLYDTLEPLYNHLDFLIQDIHGVNDGRLSIGW
ncbi:HBL/NHE enterotoxin family protein, partial [Bacillus cereus]